MTVSWNGKIFFFIDRIWKNFRCFYHNNYTLFDILFLILYLLEQLFLIYFLYLYPNYPSLIASIFAIVVITTVSIQKIMLDSKNKAVKEENTELTMNYNKLIGEYTHIKNLRKGREL